MDRLTRFVQEHWLPVLIVTGLAVLAALAAIWQVFTHDTVPDFFTKRGWFVSHPAWYYGLLVALAFALTVLQVVLFRSTRIQRTTGTDESKTYLVMSETEMQDLSAERDSLKASLSEAESRGQALAESLEQAKAAFETMRIEKNQVTDMLKDALKEGHLAGEKLKLVQEDRDMVTAELKATKSRFGRERLASLRYITFKKGPEPAGDAREVHRPSVLIRYVGHGPDYGLVSQMEEIFNECTGWHVDVDGKNDPLLRPDPRFKVVFETFGDSCLSSKVASAFSAGELLSVPVGHCGVEEPSNPALVVVRVLPPWA